MVRPARWNQRGQDGNRPPVPPAIIVNVAAPANSEAVAAAQIHALANPQTAKALQNLQDLLSTNVITVAEFHAAKDKLLGIHHSAGPAGWYDDGSGRLRWWDGHQWTGQFAAAGVRPTTSSHRWWTWSPAYTFGLFAFIPALHAAIKLKRGDLWVWASGLIAGDLVVWILLGGSPSNPDGSNTPIQNVGAFLAFMLAVVGTIHAFRVRDEVFGELPAGSAVAGTPTGLEPAIVDSLAARKRRAESAALSMKDPGLARDLRIGRPDLARQYDDGGLIDVNHVPEPFLVSHLGLSAEQARTVIEARDRIGGFQSAAELCGFADVPPKTLDAIRDRIVTL